MSSPLSLSNNKQYIFYLKPTNSNAIFPANSSFINPSTFLFTWGNPNLLFLG